MRTFLDTILEQAQADIQTDAAKGAREYLESRGVTKEQVTQFGIGYIPKALTEKPQSLPFESRRFWGWAKQGTKLSNRLVFPLCNARGQVLGIEIKTPSRSVKDYDKYTLTRIPDGHFLGVKQALPHIWETKYCFVTEGIFDFYPLQRLFPNTLCTVTARISVKQIDFLLRTCKTIVLVYDNDRTSIRRVAKIKEQYGQRVQILSIDGYPAKDLGELWENFGERKFSKYMREQKDALMLDLLIME